MNMLINTVLAGLLGLSTGIFLTLSLIERPIWRLMWAPLSDEVKNTDARNVHSILKRVIHLLPPTMMTTMLGVSVLLSIWIRQTGLTTETITLCCIFFGQLVPIVLRLRRDIRGVDLVDSDGDIATVRKGLGSLALLHHRGLLMTSSTLVFLWIFSII